jgi:hypothetical protein
VEDNPYIVILSPPEYHELLSEYENYVEWAQKSMTAEQSELSARVLKQLHHSDATHVCLDEVDQPEPETQAKQFTRDDVARICASTLSAVFAKRSIPQTLEGIAVLPQSKGVWLIDLVMRDLTANEQWTVLLTILNRKEETPDEIVDRGA